jgi:DNA-binding transcriptional LysR family regulator
MIESRQLRYFVAVARRLHFTRAAEDLLIAQPALSQAIRQLERELGVALFDRTTRGVTLTSAGEVLLRGAERTLRELEVTVAEVRSFTGQVTGRVRLGAWQSMEVRLPDLLAAFRDAHPAVDVAINEIVSDAMLDAVRAGSLDVAMVVQRDHVSMAGLTSQPFITEPYEAAVSATHALAQRTSVRLEELAEEPFVMHRPGSAVRDAILRACADAGFRPRIALETGEMSAARAFVAAGLGITILPRSSLRSPGPEVHLVPLRPELTRTSILVWPADRQPSTAARTFVEFTRAHTHLLA